MGGTMWFRHRKSNEQGIANAAAAGSQTTATGLIGMAVTGPDVADRNGQQQEETATTGRTQVSLDEIDAAISNGRVDLGHMVAARYLSQKETNSGISETSRAEYADRFAKLLSSYCQEWRIVALHFCTLIPAAVILQRCYIIRRRWRPRRKRPLELDIVYFPEALIKAHPEIEAVIWKARSYYLDLSQCRSLPRRDGMTRGIYFLIVTLLGLADGEAMPQSHEHERTQRAMPKIDEALKQVGSDYNRALIIEARHSYLTGMLIGALALGGGVWAIEFLVHLLTKVHIDTLGLGVVIAGGIGAILSVMTRLTANNLRVDPEAGRSLVLLAGSFRPLIGGIFAFAVYVFVKGGLIPIKVTATGIQATYFFLGIAFLAGFSERFAQDAVTRAG